MNNLLSYNQLKIMALFDSQFLIRTGDIVQKLGIPRPTVKQTLTRLEKMGLIEQHGLGRASYYCLKQEAEILDPKGRQLVIVYKGKESFRHMFDQLSRQLKRGDYYWSFAFKNEYHDATIRDLLENFHHELTKNGVDDRAIASNDVENLVRENFKAVPRLQLRFTNVEIPVGTIILNDAVINLVWGEQPLAVVIKTPEIFKRYYAFFENVWDQAEKKSTRNLPKSGNTPITSLHGCFGIKTLWMKDETKNPTHTFKDRLAYEMVRPLFEQYKSGQTPSQQTTFGSISYGNTAKSMGHYVHLLNNILGKEVAKAVAFVPPKLEKRTFGPDSRGKMCPANVIMNDIKKTCRVIPIDLKKKLYRSKDLEELAREHDKTIGTFFDITEGLNRPAYVQIIIEAIEQQLKESPDYVIVPFGAGILCNEIIDYISDHHLHTKVIPVSSGDPKTIAIMLYGPIWVDTKALSQNGWGWTRHENPDRKGRKRDAYKVYHVSDQELLFAMKVLKEKGIDAEPSGASGFAFLPRLKSIDPTFDSKKHSVLVINTGDSLLNHK